ncbi:MAG: HlyU family transcriptional regulator [Rhizobiaceae bacterium]|nr:HlyU family transcriptional regulator [Rhizobiaceae bacterium]
MSFLKKLFGITPGEPKAAKPVETVEHEGFLIATTPMDEGGQFRVCALISKEIDGEIKTHKLIRADILPNKEQASDEAIRKAKVVIGERGERLFDSRY